MMNTAIVSKIIYNKKTKETTTQTYRAIYGFAAADLIDELGDDWTKKIFITKENVVCGFYQNSEKKILIKIYGEN